MSFNAPAQIPQQPNSAAITDSTGRVSTSWSLFFNNLVLTVKGLVSSVTNLQQNVAGLTATKPCFSAWQSVAQTLPAATVTKVNFQTVEFDTTTAYDNTLMRFTPKVAGYYQISAGVYVTAAGGGLLYLYKNGVVYKYGEYATSEYISILSCLVYLNGTTDYAELMVYGGAAVNTTSNTIASTYFQGVFVNKA